jgi:multimeric flavodoxin WrbA
MITQWRTIAHGAQRIVNTNILIIGLPIWFGQPPSVSKRVLERPALVASRPSESMGNVGFVTQCRSFINIKSAGAGACGAAGNERTS